MISNNQADSSSLFSPSSSNNMNSQEDYIESKLLKRQQDFINSENFNDIKENTMSSELSFGENSRNLIFKQRRLKQNKLIEETTYPLKSKISISLEWFEKCNSSNFTISQISEIMQAFKNNSDINQKYFGLVGLRKILLLPETPIQDLLNEGIIPDLLQLLDLNSNPEFQNEALLCLSYITSNTNEQISNFVAKQGMQIFLKLFDSSIEEIKLQIPLLIGNLINNSFIIKLS